MSLTVCTVPPRHRPGLGVSVPRSTDVRKRVRQRPGPGDGQSRGRGSQQTLLPASAEGEPQDHVGRRPGIRHTRAPVLVVIWRSRDPEGGAGFCRPSLSRAEENDLVPQGLHELILRTQ